MSRAMSSAPDLLVDRPGDLGILAEQDEVTQATRPAPTGTIMALA